MPYQYFLSGSVAYFNSPQNILVDQYQTFINDQFNVSPNVFLVQKETFLGSGSYVDIVVRVENAVDEFTGIKLGDDFKVLLFASLDESIYVGEKYYFDDNYWLTVNTSRIKGLANRATVRRCNNVLRWTDVGGNIFSEPCIIDYKISTPNNNRFDPMSPEGTISIIAQLNSNTNNIRENQRFLFGNSNNWMAYKVYGGGILNYLNNKTSDNLTTQIVSFAMGKSFVNNETDDIVLGIADRYKFYSSGSEIISNIQILPVSGSILESGSQLYSVMLYYGSVPQPDGFIITVSGSSAVPENKYIFSASANAFSVINNGRYLNEPLLIQCLSGSNIRIFDIYLRGDW